MIEPHIININSSVKGRLKIERSYCHKSPGKGRRDTIYKGDSVILRIKNSGCCCLFFLS